MNIHPDKPYNIPTISVFRKLSILIILDSLMPQDIAVEKKRRLIRCGGVAIPDFYHHVAKRVATQYLKK